MKSIFLFQLVSYSTLSFVLECLRVLFGFCFHDLSYDNHSVDDERGHLKTIFVSVFKRNMINSIFTQLTFAFLFCMTSVNTHI